MSSATRMRRTSPTTSGRFGRTAPRRTPQRRMVAGGWLQRRQPPKPSTMERIMGGRSRKAGAMALVAGAAGALFMRRRSDRNAPLS